MNVLEIPAGQAVSVEVECIGVVEQSTRYKVKRDASLSMGGIEVVMTTQRPQNGQVSFPDLDDVRHCSIDRTCGLHVHIDVRDLSRMQAIEVYKRLVLLTPVLKMLVPVSRHNNRYCRWRSNISGSRYSAINFQSFYKFQTIEFRCQSGSTERKKIEMWAELCYQMVQWARTADRTTRLTWKAFMQILTPELREWVIRRRVKLHTPHLRQALNVALAGGVVSTAERTALKALCVDMVRRDGIISTVTNRAERTVRTRRRNSSSSLLRRMGQLGVTQEQAEYAMSLMGVSIQPSTIRFMLRAGAEGRPGSVANLTAEEVRVMYTPAL